MQINIREILKLQGFSNSKIIAGNGGANRIVKNATLMEVPDIFPYVERDSLLITTLYPIHNDKEAIKELIPRLNDLGVSGICIKPERYVMEIPNIMIRQADELDFPLIELSTDSNLSNLTIEILELSLKRHIKLLNFRSEVHEKMMDLFLKGKGFNALIENLSQIVKKPVFLLDSNLNIIATTQDLDLHQINYSLNKHECTGDNGSLNHKDIIAYLEVKTNDKLYSGSNLFIYPVKVGDDYLGYIVILGGNKREKQLLVATEQTSLLVASVFQTNNAVAEKEKSFFDSFIRDILQGKVESKNEVFERAKTFGWDLEFPQIIMIIKIFDKNEKAKKESYRKLLKDGLIERLFNEKTKAVFIDDSIVIFINASYNSHNRNAIDNISNKILKSINTKSKVGIGISTIINDVSQYSSYYSEIRDVVIISERMNKESYIVFYDELMFFSIINKIENDRILIDYVMSRLGKIIEYDKKNDTDLLKTLVCLIECNFNLRKTSEKLFIHYNTLRYRVEKLESLGVNINNGFIVSDLALAYKIYVYLNSKNII